MATFADIYIIIPFCTVTKKYRTNSFFPDVIEHKAIQAQADAHCQKSVYGKLVDNVLTAVKI